MSIVDDIKEFIESKGGVVTIYKIDEGVPYKGIMFSYDWSTNSDDWISEFSEKFSDIHFLLTPQSMTVTASSKACQYEKDHKENLEVMREWEKM
jgi:hypothetical protein